MIEIKTNEHPNGNLFQGTLHYAGKERVEIWIGWSDNGVHDHGDNRTLDGRGPDLVISDETAIDTIQPHRNTATLENLERGMVCKVWLHNNLLYNANKLWNHLGRKFEKGIPVGDDWSATIWSSVSMEDRTESIGFCLDITHALEMLGDIAPHETIRSIYCTDG